MREQGDSAAYEPCETAAGERQRVRRRVIRWFRLTRLLDAAAALCAGTALREARVGEEFPLECPNCGGDIRLIAFITEPGPIRKILTHLGEPLEPPPASPAHRLGRARPGTRPPRYLSGVA
jgi:hypothetical protein